MAHPHAPFRRAGTDSPRTEIAARLGIEEPTLAGSATTGSRRHGWIKRRRSAATDRRCKIVHLQRRAERAVLDRNIQCHRRVGCDASCYQSMFRRVRAARPASAFSPRVLRQRGRGTSRPQRRTAATANGRPTRSAAMKLIAMTTMTRVNVATREAVGHLEHRFGRKRVYRHGGVIARRGRTCCLLILAAFVVFRIFQHRAAHT